MVILVLNMFVRPVLVHLVPINTIRNLLLNLKLNVATLFDMTRHNRVNHASGTIRAGRNARGSLGSWSARLGSDRLV